MKSFLEHEADAMKEKQRLDGEVKSEKRHVQDLEYLVQRLKDEMQRLKDEAREKATRPGELVNIFEYKPPIGTRVIGNGRPVRQGEVICNEEDGGTEIGVRWDNGVEHHNLKCGKKRGWALKYM